MPDEHGAQSDADPNESPSTVAAEQQARAFVEALIASEYAEASSYLADEVRTEIVENAEAIKSLIKPEPETILAECWLAMTNLYGSFEAFEIRDSTSSEDEVVVTITIECAQETFSLDVPVDASGSIPDWAFIGEYSLPEYADAAEVVERELAVETEDMTLPGTLTLPADADTVPGVVLVHSAGAVDRDGTVGANKTLEDLAWGLAMHGIGSLRYDKRSFVEEIPDTEVDFDTVVTDDAVMAIDTLAGVDAIDAENVFVVGHSLGGTCAPYIAHQHDDIAGIVNLDGRCLGNSKDSAVAMVREHWAQRDNSNDYSQQQVEETTEKVNRIESGEANPEEQLLGKPVAWNQHHDEYTSDWLATTQSLSLPFLIAKTGRDLPEYSEKQAETLRGELATTDVQVNYYEELNHYFQRGGTPASIYETANFRKPPAEQIVRDVADFISETAGTTK